VGGNQAFLPEQLSFDESTSILTADVLGGSDLEVFLLNRIVQPEFDPALDVIA
jgi:hypothetical protein